MAEGGFRPRPPMDERELARRVEAGAERREDREGVPCAAESLQLAPGDMATLEYRREMPDGQAQVLDVLVANIYDPQLGPSVQCPHNGVVNDFVEGKPFELGQTVGDNCRRCWQAIYAAAKTDPSLPPAPKE